MDMLRELRLRYSGTYVNWNGTTLYVTDSGFDEESMPALQAHDMTNWHVHIPMRDTKRDDVRTRPAFGYVRDHHRRIYYASRRAHGYKYSLHRDGVGLSCPSSGDVKLLDFYLASQLFRKDRSENPLLIRTVAAMLDYGVILNNKLALKNTHLSSHPVLFWQGIAVGKYKHDRLSLADGAAFLADECRKYFNEVEV